MKIITNIEKEELTFILAKMMVIVPKFQAIAAIYQLKSVGGVEVESMVDEMCRCFTRLSELLSLDKQEVINAIYGGGNNS